jgi:hypothetical protein
MIQFPLRPSQPQSPFASALQSVAMDPRIQAGIFAGESGGNYNTLFGNAQRPGGPFAGTDLTRMTVNQVAQFTDPNGPYAQWVKSKIGRVATPTGAYQVVGTTLRNAAKAMGLTGNELYDKSLQDRIGEHILQTQGTGAWAGYKGPRTPGRPLGASGPQGKSGAEGVSAQPQSSGQQVADAVLGDSSIKSVGADKSGGGLRLGAPRQTAPAQLPEVAPAQKRDLSGLVEALSQGQTQPLASQPPEVRLRALAAYGQMV